MSEQSKLTASGKAYGYNCAICSNPLYDNEVIVHTADGVAHYSCTESTLEDAARRLVERLEVIHNDEHYKHVWISYAIHGGDYSNGPTYTKEFAELKAELAKL